MVKHVIKIKVEPKDIPEWHGGIRCKCKDMQSMTTANNGEILHGVYCTCDGSGIGCSMNHRKIGEIDLDIPFKIT